MAGRDPFELVEVSPGAEPPSGIGDRVLVGLALIALVGGALIAVTNALPDADELAEASIEPSAPVRTPRPAPTPIPPRVIAVERRDVVAEPITYAPTFSGWIRANVDLVIRYSPEPNGLERGMLLQGEVAYADQGDEQAGEAGWLALQPPHEGWIASVDGENQLVERYQQPTYITSGYVRSVTAGPDGFVALVWPPGDSFSYHNSYPVASLDGVTWQSGSSTAFAGSELIGVAWGSAGWLAVSNTNGPDQNEISLWTSHNGLAWSPLGIMAGMQGAYALQISASDRAYLLETSTYRGDSNTLWSSADRLTWRESVKHGVDPGNTGWGRTNAFSAGFYRWNGDQTDVRIVPAAFSQDGETWSRVEDGPSGVNRPMTSIEDRILAIDVDPQTMAPRVWVGTVAGDTLLWRHDSSADASFAGAVVTQLVTAGQRALAFGWDRSTEEPLTWSGDGHRWLRESLPESFGGPPQLAAAGGSGVVLVGHRPTLRGDNPIFWRLTARGWEAEAEPVLELVPDPSTDACPAPPSDFLAFSVIDHAAAIVCFGDAPITFRAWSVSCEGCYGTGPGAYRPDWLANPIANQLLLSPIEENTGWWTSVVVDPSLAMDSSWTETVLEITGHFDDPAAATCHYEPAAQELSYWSGQRSFIDQCRQSFVVTAVSVVSSL